MICVIGPTASGKTSLAVEVAKIFNGEIISADSRQVYRGMDIGTGKDLSEYDNIKYHLIDIAVAGEKYDVFRYQQDFDKAYSDTVQRGKMPVLCGGSGLYIEAAIGKTTHCFVPEDPILREMLASMTDEQLGAMLAKEVPLHNHTDTEIRERCIRAIEIALFKKKHCVAERTPPPNIIFTLDFDAEILRMRIDRRLMQRINSGMIEEVRSLLSSGIKSELLRYYGLEYRYITEYLLKGETQQNKDEMIRLLRFAINQFAKRQRTWLRGMERRGYTIHHIDGMLPLKEQVLKVVVIANANANACSITNA
ncbi:MAG: tRNA (adenosine(37)-N6)-dimethylallyltransferase MiaA [Bacteroidales bacterium]|jgi:tRNA dimethylallyltransferase|nr:tRNA (adenosine(37)-N6)-dimethylallyltransferase MiaA [Bacteroidales bacterium]